MKSHRLSVAWFWMTVLCWATGPLPAVEVRPPLENKITQALRKRIAVNFVNTPLSNVLKELAAAANVPYFVDHASLVENEVKFNVPVTLKRDEQPIGRTLEEVLQPLGLDYFPQPEWLYVLAGATHCEWMEIRHFDVSRLVSLIEPRLVLYRSPLTEKLLDPNSEPNGQAQFFGGAFGGGLHDTEAKQKADKTAAEKATRRVRIEEQDPRFPAEACLMAYLQATTSGQWEDIDGVGGTMTPASGRLVVRQSPTVQREVLEVLSDLEMMLSNPPPSKRLRLRDSDEDRQKRAAFDRLLDAPTDSPPGAMSLKKFIDDNFVAHGLPFVVDQAAFEDEGLVWDDLKITVVAGVSRRTLLKEAFHPYMLQIFYEDDVFKVVCLAKADEILAIFLYDVSDIPEARDREWLARALMDDTSGQWEEIDGVGGTLDLTGADDLVIGGLLMVSTNGTSA